MARLSVLQGRREVRACVCKKRVGAGRGPDLAPAAMQLSGRAARCNWIISVIMLPAHRLLQLSPFSASAFSGRKQMTVPFLHVES